jgi:XTP/dITP diphosphohydrolase
MARLTVLVTSPRLPAGLLSATAWRAVDRADLVTTADTSTPLAVALAAAGVAVQARPAAGQELIALAADRSVVWLAADDGDPALTHELAEAVVRRSESAATGPDVEVEVVVGSFDPVGARLLDAVSVMDTLRERCPWDREQTHESLTPYLVEEVYEVIEAIETAQPDLLREELGDVLFQVLFHARVASEHPDSPFSVDDVAAGLVEKLVRRHPHVFADTEVSGAADVEANWQQIKRTEKARESMMDGIPLGLPALSLATSVVDRAMRARSASGASPLSVPVPEGGTAYTEETLGEVLFALVAAARAGGLDAERALRARVRAEIAALRDSEQRAMPAGGAPRG